MILRQNRNNQRLIFSENLFFRGHYKLKQFRKVARKSEEVGPPCFRKTSQHFGGTCKPATVSKGYRSTKSLGNPALNHTPFFGPIFCHHIYKNPSEINAKKLKAALFAKQPSNVTPAIAFSKRHSQRQKLHRLKISN